MSKYLRITAVIFVGFVIAYLVWASTHYIADFIIGNFGCSFAGDIPPNVGLGLCINVFDVLAFPATLAISIVVWGFLYYKLAKIIFTKNVKSKS